MRSRGPAKNAPGRRMGLFPIAWVLVALAALGAAAPGEPPADQDTPLEATTAPEVSTLTQDENGDAWQPVDGGESIFADQEKQDAFDSYFNATGPGRGLANDSDNANQSETGGFWTQILQTAAALCGIIALILILYKLFDRFGRKHPLLAGAKLGSVLGRVYLAPGIALHFVRVRDRVLVVGVAGKTVSAVAEFDAATFDKGAEQEPEPQSEPQPTGSEGDRPHFLEQLKAAGARMRLTQQAKPPQTEEIAPTPDETPANLEEDDDEIAALRDGIQRLQKQIRDTSRELDE